jgi:hypothetical protein
MGQNLTPRSAPACLLPPNADIGPRERPWSALPFCLARPRPLAGEGESVVAGALGGAALGSVIALAVSSTAVLAPVIGAVIGLVGGSGLGHLLNRRTERPEAERRQADLLNG